jgi:hypothetical protein
VIGRKVRVGRFLSGSAKKKIAAAAIMTTTIPAIETKLITTNFPLASRLQNPDFHLYFQAYGRGPPKIWSLFFPGTTAEPYKPSGQKRYSKGQLIPEILMQHLPTSNVARTVPTLPSMNVRSS